MTTRCLLAVLAGILTVTHPIAAQPPAAPAASAPKQPAKPGKPPVYNESADAKSDIAAAVARAAAENKRVLIQWGANWCHWCTLLHDTFKTNEKIAETLRNEYEVVFVDVGRGEKNADLAST